MRRHQQYCNYCGIRIGYFEYDRFISGPPMCGDSECNRMLRLDIQYDVPKSLLFDAFKHRGVL